MDGLLQPAEPQASTLILKPAVNRIVNLVLGSLHILLAISLLFGPGETWAYFYWFSA